MPHSPRGEGERHGAGLRAGRKRGKGHVFTSEMILMRRLWRHEDTTHTTRHDPDNQWTPA
ncbi:hypothetical protein E2C01_101926 [Portunus trituberculatus]|uniref:Uncharacterized protein n=1 Tax=Portunus trituberculatus TaxID=210409 RepID=A0A5B7KH48_PORTR|nr:hypothetical protein [Portunus trituberculatus]